MLAVLLFGVQKSEIIGTWESSGDYISFDTASGFNVGNKKYNYRKIGENTVRIFKNDAYRDCHYHVKNDGTQMLFDGKRYVRAQSGLERSIMEFLL